jgi:hypothetical protein
MMPLRVTTDSLGRIREARPDSPVTAAMKDIVFATMAASVRRSAIRRNLVQRRASGPDQHFPFSTRINQTASH